MGATGAVKKALRLARALGGDSPDGASKLDMSPAARAERAKAQGYVGPVYHGAKRGDRIHEAGGFKADRATSGPMSYFTDNPEIASNYAKGKEDTSYEVEDWESLFTVNGKPLAKAWDDLPTSTRVKIREQGHLLHQKDDGSFAVAPHERAIPDDATSYSKQTWDQYLRHPSEGAGNGLRGLHKVWVESGNLFDQEEKFVDALKAMGVKGAKYEDPNAEFPTVFPKYLGIKNPLDTANIPEHVMDSLRKAADSAPEPEAQVGMDTFDKRAQNPKWWKDTLDRDARDGTAYAWVTVPDWATDVLKSHGYDGIRDTGGKRGGETHNVYIPFGEDQVRPYLDDFKPTAPSPVGGEYKVSGIPAPERAGRAAGGEIPAPTGAYQPIVHEGQSVGRAKISDEGTHLHLDDIEVSPSMQGQGIGSAFIESLKGHGRPITLDSDAMRGRDNQQRQRGLYERLGFEKNKGPEALSVKIGTRRIYPEYVWRPQERQARAHGGATKRKFHAGPIHSHVAGRTDHLPMTVKSGSYVLPADVVSAHGEGNTIAGFKVMRRTFGGTPYGGGKGVYGQGDTPYGEPLPKADGGEASGDQGVEIIAAGGEYVLTPEEVMRVGSGDLEVGHRVLDEFVTRSRAEHVKTLKELPGPAQS